MSLDAIREVNNAEAALISKRTETVAACKKLISEADARGKNLLDSVVATVEKQEKEILAVAEAKAEAEAVELLKKAAIKADQLEKLADSNIASTAGFIVERIVMT